jgi:single-strand DNA-binding protein
MILTGVARLGADAELRATPNGEVVANLSLAWNYGRKGQDGRKPVQWVRAALWGKQAEALQEYLLKGRQVWVILSDVHLREWQSDKGSGSSLEGRVEELELVGGRGNGNEPAAGATSPAGTPQRKLNDFPDDDVPF